MTKAYPFIQEALEESRRRERSIPSVGNSVGDGDNTTVRFRISNKVLGASVAIENLTANFSSTSTNLCAIRRTVRTNDLNGTYSMDRREEKNTRASMDTHDNVEGILTASLSLTEVDLNGNVESDGRRRIGNTNADTTNETDQEGHTWR